MATNKKNFPWFKNNPGLIYLDSGATSLKPQIVIDEVVKYLSSESYNTHNLDSIETYKSKIAYDETKQLLANYFNTNIQNIAYTFGATSSLNIIALGLEKLFENGGEIILSTIEHSSNILPFIELTKRTKAKIKYINSKELFLTEKDILDSITPETKIISFSNSSNLIGYKINAEKISLAIKKINPNILISVDATQYAATKKMDLRNSGIDFTVCGAHKMLGPTGIGMLFVSDFALKIIEARIVGGGMNLSIEKLSYRELPSIEKLESGTLNVEGIYGWRAALKYYNSINQLEEEKRLYDLKNYLELEMKKMNDYVIHNPNIKSNILIFSRKNVTGQDFVHYLDTEKIIARSGLSCAKLIHENIKVNDVVRISMHFYTSKDDIEILISVLKKFKSGDEFNLLV